MVGSRDVKDVNDWVAQQTGRKVPRFMATSFPRIPGVNTVSAAYFKGRSDVPKSGQSHVSYQASKG